MATTTIQQSVVVTEVFGDDAGYLWGVSYYTTLQTQGSITIDSQDPVSRTIVFHRDDTITATY